jgi:hypothetical protein
VRQVAAALGLAALAALATTQQAQLFADRAALTPATKIPRADGHTGPLSAKAFAAAYQQFQHLRLAVLATSYSNLFLLIAALTATGVVLALFLRAGPATPSTPPQPSSTSGRVGRTV